MKDCGGAKRRRGPLGFEGELARRARLCYAYVMNIYK